MLPGLNIKTIQEIILKKSFYLYYKYIYNNIIKIYNKQFYR